MNRNRVEGHSGIKLLGFAFIICSGLTAIAYLMSNMVDVTSLPFTLFSELIILTQILVITITMIMVCNRLLIIKMRRERRRNTSIQ